MGEVGLEERKRRERTVMVWSVVRTCIEAKWEIRMMNTPIDFLKRKKHRSDRVKERERERETNEPEGL